MENNRQKLINLLENYKLEQSYPFIEEFKGFAETIQKTMKTFNDNLSRFQTACEELINEANNMDFGENEISSLYLDGGEYNDTQFAIESMFSEAIDYIIEDYNTFINSKNITLNKDQREALESGFNSVKVALKKIEDLESDYDNDIIGTFREINKEVEEYNIQGRDKQSEESELEDAENDFQSLDEEDECYDSDYDELENKINELNESVRSYERKLNDIGDEIKGKAGIIEEALNSHDIYSKIDELVDVFENEVVEVFHDIIHEYNPELMQSCSKLYERTFIKNDSSDFLKRKELEESLYIDVTPKTQNDVRRVIVFEDRSIGYFDSENNFNAINENNYSYKDNADNIVEILMNEALRKKPKYQKIFSNIFGRTEKYSDSFHALHEFMRFENLFKSKNINIEEAFKGFNAEKVIDFIIKIEEEAKVERLAKSIMSKKYQHLITPETLKYFKEIKDLDIPVQHLQENIGSKLAAFKEPEDLKKALVSYINLISDFNMDSIKLKAVNQNCDIILESEDKLILKVNDYRASDTLGSRSWCITRYESYFNSYTKGNNQYFIYDFSKESKNRESMIGITIKPEGTHRAAHFKNDSSLQKNEYEPYIKEIIKADVKRYQSKISKARMTELGLNLVDDRGIPIGLEQKTKNNPRI